MKRYITLLALLLLAVQSIWAQSRQITGTVKDKSGPIPGATVFEKNAPGNGTSTDNDGNFKLTVKSGVIVVKAISYLSQEVNITGRNRIVVTLTEDVKGLEEVVVLGYGTQKKITLTGAASSVSGRDIRQNPSASLQNTLIGKLPGYTSQQRTGRPGADAAEFYIRGQSTFVGTAANNPLIIVDDIEYSYDQFQRIDANEIESLTILKDASTTAVYGVRGANGVVVVTTRRGQAGKPQVALTNETALMQPTKFPKFLNAYDAARLLRQAQINDNATSATPVANYQPKFSEADLQMFKDHSDPYGHPDNDWGSILFKKFSVQNNTNINVSGGSDNVKYFIGGGYLSQGGILRDFSQGQGYNSNYYNNRYNYRSNLDINISKTTSVRVDLAGNVSEINTPRVGSPFASNDVFWEIGQFRSLSPFNYPIYNPDGSYGYSTFQRDFFGGSNYNNNNVNNVVGRLTYFGYNRNYENNMNLNTTLNQKLDGITKGLSFKGVLAYSSAYTYSRSLTRDNFPSYIYDVPTNTYSPKDPSILRVVTPVLGYGAGSTIRTLNYQLQLNYDNSFGPHHISALILANQSSVTSAKSNVAYNFVPNNYRGLTGRINYDFKQRYLLSLVTAYNGSDRFAEGHRYGLFPAMSAGWNVAEEPLVKKHLPFLDQFKLRASYGLVGNDKIGGDPNNLTYYYQQTYNTGNGVNGYTGSFGTTDNPYTGIVEGTLPNNNVTWEKQREFDLGLDFGLFKKVTATVDVFRYYRYDIITTRGAVSGIFGQALPPVNLGRTKNEGYEASITYRDRIGKDFSFSIGGNVSYAKNTILFQDEPQQLYPWLAFTGKSFGAIRVYQFQGYYASKADIAASPIPPIGVIPGDLKFADLNNDGKIDQYDQYATDLTNLPRLIYGVPLSFTYRNVSMSVLLQGAGLFNVRGIAEQIQAFSSNLQPIHLQAWTPELGDNAKYPVLSYAAGRTSDPRAYPADYWYRRADYLRLKNVEMSYSLPSKFVQKLHMHDIRIYANGTNLLLWTRLNSLYQVDPEVSSGSDRVPYPPQRMYNLGFNLTF